jgi:RNA polymerase sigma factor (sigma-70 family)
LLFFEEVRVLSGYFFMEKEGRGRRLVKGKPATVGLARDLETLWQVGALGSLDDASLLERFIERGAGSDAAFEALIRRHGGMVLRVCRQVLGDAHDAQDAAQATFLVLAQKPRSIRRREALAGWLHGTAARIASRARRDATRRRVHERQFAQLQNGRETDATFELDRSWSELHQEMERLPGRYRTAIVLCDLEGLSHEQAAGRLGCPPRTLQTRLYRGRERLRQKLIRRGLAPAVALVGVNLAKTASAAFTERFVSHTSRVVSCLDNAAWSAGVSDAVLNLARRRVVEMGLARLKVVSMTGLLLGTLTLSAVGYARSSVQDEPVEGPKAIAKASKPAKPPLKRAFKGEPPPLTRWHTYEIEVVDHASGEPLGDSQVLVVEFVNLKAHEFMTDGKGFLRVEYPEIDGQRAAVEVRKAGYVPQYLGLGDSPGPLEEKFTASLRPALTVGGKVVDLDDKPIQGATVVVSAQTPGRIRLSTGPAVGYENTTEVPCITEDDGTWRCPYFLPSATVAKIQLIHPDYVSGTGMAIHGPEVRSPSVEVLKKFADRQVMRRGVRFAGRVLDPEGHPVAGAEVIDTAKGLSFLPFTRHASTDKEGAFHFHFDPKETAYLVVQAPGFAQFAWKWDAEVGKGPLDFRLQKGRLLRGRVVDERDKPLGAVMVCIPSYNATGWISPRLWTNERGEFSWDGSVDEAVTLDFGRRGYSAATRDVAPSEKETVIVLQRRPVIALDVLDAKTGEQVKKFHLGIVPIGPDGREGETRVSSMQAQPGGHGVDLDLKSPAYKLRILAEGYAPFESRIFKLEEEGVKLDATLKPVVGGGDSGPAKQE